MQIVRVPYIGFTFTLLRNAWKSTETRDKTIENVFRKWYDSDWNVYTELDKWLGAEQLRDDRLVTLIGPYSFTFLIFVSPYESICRSNPRVTSRESDTLAECMYVCMYVCALCTLRLLSGTLRLSNRFHSEAGSSISRTENASRFAI